MAVPMKLARTTRRSDRAACSSGSRSLPARRDRGLGFLDRLRQLLGRDRGADDTGLRDLQLRHPGEAVHEGLSEAVDGPVVVRVHAAETEAAAAVGPVVG